MAMRTLKLKTRINLAIIILLVIIFAGLGITLFVTVKREIVTETGELINVKATNQISKVESDYSIPIWQLNGQPLYNKPDLVDEIKSKTEQTATIFQKIKDGYLRIATNVLKQDGSRATGTYIPNSSEVVESIEKGITYFGRAFVVDDWYLTAYEPIKINGIVKGILYVGVKEKDYAMIKKIFSDKKYYQNGYPFVVSETGDLLIHPKNEILLRQTFLNS